MGRDKEEKSKGKEKDEIKCKEECCKKYLKKGKHCKDCPLAGQCRLPG
jgi:hypothetical protein